MLCSFFLNVFGNFRLVLLIKDLSMKIANKFQLKRRSKKFHCKQNREACFRFIYVKQIIQNISRKKKNENKIVYSSLKNMLLHGIGARVDVKCQNLNSFLKKSGEYLEYEKFLLNLYS